MRVGLRQIERQALEGHRQVHALQLDITRHGQRAGREVQDGLDARRDHQIDHGLRARRRHRNHGDVEPILARHASQLLDVVDRHAAPRLVPDLLVCGVEERRNLEAFLPESGVVRERQAEIAGAHDRHAQPPIESQDLPQVPPQFLHVVAHAADAELPEVRQVLANLRGVQVELLGQRLRRDRLDSGGVECVQAAQVDREPVGRQLGDLVRHLPPLVRLIHKVQCYHLAPMANRQTSDAPPETAAFKPYVPASQSPAEFTLKAIVLGVLFGLLFGASTVYLGLRAGLTVSASIPIAVLAISVLKKLGGSTILENNIVQTIGSAGESLAAGVVFTIPALIFLVPLGPAYFNYVQITVLAIAGGLLGVLMMVPLRRALIVKEHGVLPYPEGTACADVLVAGERGGALAKTVFLGLGIGALWKGASWIVQIFRTTIGYTFDRASFFPNASINLDLSPEYMGVGYVIGPRIAGVMFAGGVLSWLVLLPLLSYLGNFMTVPLPPVPASGLRIDQMSAGQLWSAYIRYTGAGAVLAAGLITLARTVPTIVTSFRESVKDFGAAGGAAATVRTERDMPLTVVIGGSILLAIFLVLAPGAPTQGNVLSAILVVLFGFFFVTVSSRITGLIGNSSNPISGMTIATLILTCTIFVGVGWVGDDYAPIALGVGAVVCIAAAIAGATSQDLKTGFIVGATPISQQIGLIVGVVTAAFVIGVTTLYLHDVMTIGSGSLPAPQATLMSTIIRGLLSQNLPWGLVLVGVFISVTLELCGIRSLSFAVGSYLPIATTAPIFVGGLVRWWVERKTGQQDESEISSGTLFSSGLIAGGSLAGILYAALFGRNLLPAADDAETLGLVPFLHEGTVGMVAGGLLFAALAVIVARVGMRKVQ